MQSPRESDLAKLIEALVPLAVYGIKETANKAARDLRSLVESALDQRIERLDENPEAYKAFFRDSSAYTRECYVLYMAFLSANPLNYIDLLIELSNSDPTPRVRAAAFLGMGQSIFRDKYPQVLNHLYCAFNNVHENKLVKKIAYIQFVRIRDFDYYIENIGSLISVLESDDEKAFNDLVVSNADRMRGKDEW